MSPVAALHSAARSGAAHPASSLPADPLAGRGRGEVDPYGPVSLPGIATWRRIRFAPPVGAAPGRTEARRNGRDRRRPCPQYPINGKLLPAAPPFAGGLVPLAAHHLDPEIPEPGGGAGGVD